MDTTTNGIMSGVSVMSEIKLSLADGMTLTGQRWTYQNQKQQQQQKQTTDDENDSNTTTMQPPPQPKTTIRILALHGWLDNCRSFHYLAPRLIEKFQPGEAELVAIDLPGHGLSSHRPLDGPQIILSEGAYYIAEIIDALGWGSSSRSSSNNNKSKNSSEKITDDDDNINDNNNEKVALIGHSMGGGMSSVSWSWYTT